MQHAHSLQTSPGVHQVTLSIFAILEGLLKCVNCHDALILTSKEVLLEHPFKVQCHCGMVHDIVMGSRRYARKAVWLPGRYSSFDAPVVTGEMTVEDLSFGGIGFRVQTPFTLNAGDTVHLDFALDNVAHTKVSVSTGVRNVWQDTVGVKFKSSERFHRDIAISLIP